MWVALPICGSLFAYVGLFSHMWVSFRICGSLFAYVGLFLHIRVSFRDSRSDLTHVCFLKRSVFVYGSHFVCKGRFKGRFSKMSVHKRGKHTEKMPTCGKKTHVEKLTPYIRTIQWVSNECPFSQMYVTWRSHFFKVFLMSFCSSVLVSSTCTHMIDTDFPFVCFRSFWFLDGIQILHDTSWTPSLWVCTKIT